VRRALTWVAVAGLLAGSAACKGETKRAAARRATTTTAAPTSTTTSTTIPPAPPPPRTFANASSDNATLAAADIAAAELATLDPATGPEELHNAAVAGQLAYRRIAQRDVSFEQAIAAALPTDAIRLALAYNVAASRHLIALSGNSAPKETPPAAWRIVSPAPTGELLGYYKEASATTGVPWSILAAVNFVETRLGRVRGTSSAGAQGPMQFMPATWAAYGQGDIYSIRDSIAAAARYLKANGAPERLDDAIWRYNHSKHYVEAIKAYANRIALDERAFRGYYEWEVLYRTAGGLLILPIGWPDVPAINTGGV